MIRIVRLMCLVLMGMALLGGCSGDEGSAQTETTRETIPCPIMPSKPIMEQFYADYEGKRYYFCCQICVDQFKKNPSFTIKRIEADPQLQDAVKPIP